MRSYGICLRSMIRELDENCLQGGEWKPVQLAMFACLIFDTSSVCHIG